jgi:hypothetical protein
MARRVMDSKNQLITNDYVDANALWRDFQDALEDYNATSHGLVDLLTFRTTDRTFNVLQGAYEFEEYADYTLPDSQDLSYLELSVGIEDYDLRYAYTWARILESSSPELEGRHAAALQADQRLILKQILRCVFTKTGLTLGGVTAPAFYNADGTVPPPVKNNTFTGSHTHYLASTSGTLAATDIDRMEDDLKHHGFVTDLVLMINSAQTRTIRGFTGFIPARELNHDSQLINLVSDPFVGAYSRFSILEEDWIPSGYLFRAGETASRTRSRSARARTMPHVDSSSSAAPTPSTPSRTRSTTASSARAFVSAVTASPYRSRAAAPTPHRRSSAI